MAESDGTFQLTFLEGKGLIALSARDFPAMGHVDRMVLEIPDLRFPFDLSGGVGRFKNRRMHLRELALAVRGRDLTCALASCPLHDFGLFDARMELDGDRLTFYARMVLGEREALVCIAALVRPSPPQNARVLMTRLHVYGYLPVPAPLVVQALVRAIAGNRERKEGFPQSLVSALSPAEVTVELLELVLYGIMPMHGWRMPGRGASLLRLLGGTQGEGRLSMVFSERRGEGEEERTLPPEPDEIVRYQEYTGRIGMAEEAIFRGDLSTAAHLLRSYDPIESKDEVATVRLLQLLLASPDTFAEALTLATEAQKLWPQMVDAHLAQAVIFGEQEKFAESAELYETVATQEHLAGQDMQAACAHLAAALGWAKAGNRAAAMRELESALELRRELPRASRLKILHLAKEEKWQEIPAKFGEASDAKRLGESDSVAQVLELAELGLMSKDPTVIAQAAEALRSLLQQNPWQAGPISRAEAAYQLAHLYESLGQGTAALPWLGVCLQEEAPSHLVAAAWKGLLPMLGREGDRGAYAQALFGWASDTRTGDADLERKIRMLEAARIFAGELGLAAEACTVLEGALAFSPADSAILTEYAEIAKTNPKPVVTSLRRHLGAIRPEEAAPILRMLAGLLAAEVEERKNARDVYRLLMELDPQDVESTYEYARLTWEGGERELAMPHFSKLLARGDLTEDRFARVHLFLAEWALDQGLAEDIPNHLDMALAVESDGIPGDGIVRLLFRAGEYERLVGYVSRKGIELPGDLAREPALQSALISHYRTSGQIARLADTLEAAWSQKFLQNPVANKDDFLREGLELASVLVTAPEGNERAIGVLYKILEFLPESVPVLERLGALLAEKGANDEADRMLVRKLLLTSEQGMSSLLLMRARARLEEEGGVRSALNLLQSAPADRLDDEVLALRARLAEEAEDAADARETLWLLYGRTKPEARADVAQRLRKKALDENTPNLWAREVADALLRDSPEDLALAQAYFELVGKTENLSERIGAWEDLLERFPSLPNACRAKLRLGQSEAARVAGDMAAAFNTWEEARGFDSSPQAEVDQHVERARLLLAQDRPLEARAELKKALGIFPQHPVSLDLAAELAFAAEDWATSQTLYEALWQLDPDLRSKSAGELAYRRAVIAEHLGDAPATEAACRDCLLSDPGHREGRRLLADTLFQRGEFSEAVFHVREVIRLLPKDAIAALTEARHRLAECQFRLGEYTAARQNLELVLASDPERPSSLLLLIETLQRLEQHREAAAVCERLAKLTPEPAEKAEILFRKGEILRTSVADVAGANEAYLRSSDLSPTFGPTLGRLILYYWAQGDLANLATVGLDLLSATQPPRENQEDLGILVAMAAILRRDDETLARQAVLSPMLGAPLRAEVAALRLGELVRRVERGNLKFLDRMFHFLFSILSKEFQSDLQRAAYQGLLSDPADAGIALLLGRYYEKLGKLSQARAAYSLAHFADPGILSPERLAELGEENPPHEKAWAIGILDHPLCQGPLRRVLGALAPILAALNRADPATSPPSRLMPNTLELCEDLRQRLRAPDVFFESQGEGVEVTFAHRKPIRIALGRKAESLPAPELTFFIARALEQMRGGTLAVVRSSPFQLSALLQAFIIVLGSDPAVEKAEPSLEKPESNESTRAWIDRLRDPEMARFYPPESLRQGLIEDARAALLDLPDLDGYLRGCRFTADRVGLLATGRPLVALRALAGMQKVGFEGDVSDGAQERRQEQLRASPALRELVAFMLSEEYRSLIDGT